MTPALDTGATRANGDRELVDALRLRHSTAAERLVSTYGDRAARLATHLIGNEKDAEEAVQEAFSTVIRHINSFRGTSAFGAWLDRTVADAAYQRLRDRAGPRTDVSLDDVLPIFDEHGQYGAPVADWSAGVEDPSLQAELRTVLSAAIDDLPPDYRTALVLHDVQGLSHREIAEILSTGLVDVTSRVHRARLFVRKRLARYMVR